MNLVFFDDEIGTYVNRVDTQNQVEKAGEFRKVKRNTLGSLEIDATVREEHTSDIVLTDHPVEKGVDITDHKRILPKQITIDGVISGDPIHLDGPVDFTGRPVDAWETLQKLQADTSLIDVVTSLRTYEQMAITSLKCTRDADTGNVLNFTAVMRQVFTATSETVVAPATARPKKTNLGKKQPAAATDAEKRSLAKKGFDAAAAKIKGLLGSALPL